jgi:class 3 adenylate cyclase/tetratricopeptide (TPR) repeat protein|nr:adenylate/guanylate cyclase domain-containing protein [Caldimonas sp.]
MSEERRIVTVFFSDVAGSTAMGESNDPEDVRALLGHYYAIARHVITAHGGTLEKFIGDSVMAVFGIPQAHGDDAERGLVAALALRQAVARDPQTATLALRIGVNTGEVVATRGTATGDFLITGDAVNVAARLQQHAEPGAILVGERTRRAVTRFRFEAEMQLEVKGKREPIAAAVLLERLEERRNHDTPFLGRDHDLAQLELVARRAFSERRPQLVTVTASAGTGKSRLVAEFVIRAGAGVTVATAQCLPYGSAVTFFPLRGLVRDLLGATREEDVLPRLRDAFAGAGHEQKDAHHLADLVGATLGDATQSERRDRDEVFTAWRLLVEVLASRGPLVIVFEDLHWASDTMLDLVEHVTVSRTPTPLVMFALARPDLLDRKPSWGGGRRNCTSLALEPLDDGQTRRLVTGLAANMPKEVADRIVERAGGNPFFAGELVRAYEDRRREGALASDILLPDTVHATVLARIDALAAIERTILEYAAVVGRTARASAIHALMPHVEEDRVIQALDVLAERDLLVPQAPGAYTFRHIVIREVAYATLPRAERVRAHLRLAQWLEEPTQARANDHAEIVAYHYRQAIALAPGGRIPAELSVAIVISALERAARAAFNAGAVREAAEQLNEAVRLAPKEEHIRLLELRGDLLLFGDNAISGYGEAYRRWAEAPDPDPRVGARLLVKQLTVAGRWSGSLGQPLEPAEFASLAAEAGRLLDRAPDEMLDAKLACARAFEATSRSDVDLGLSTEMKIDVERAAALFASRLDVESESEALDALSSVHRVCFGDSRMAIEVSRRRLASAATLSLLERVDAWSVTIWDLVYVGAYDEAVDSYQDARKARRAGEPEYLLAHATAWAGYAAMLGGRWDQALELGDALLAMREESQQTMGRFTFPGWVAAIRVAAARLDTTRHAQYLSAFTAIAQVDLLTEPNRWLWTALIRRDGEAARRYLATPIGPRDRKGELLAMITFDLAENIDEDLLANLERQARHDPPVVSMRIRLAHALNGETAALRQAVVDLDQHRLVADAARAAALLALRTKTSSDRQDAERRLGALGDRAYMQRLVEEW